MRFCGACGAQAGPTLRFCTSCGANLQPVRSGTAPDSVVASPAPAVPWPVVAPPPADAPDSVFGGPSTPAPRSARPVPQPAEPEQEEDGYWEQDPDDEGGRRSVLVAAALLAGLLAVGGGCLLADRLLLGGDDASTAAQDAPPTSAPVGAPDPAVDSAAPSSGPIAAGTPSPPAGTDPLTPRSASATCQALPGTDAASAPVTYDPANTLDGVGGTAWRCAGSAVGEQLVFDFGRPVVLASVGLVPGYDKTDPADGTDRFGENRTVTAVTWRFDGGAVQAQDIPEPGRAVARARLTTPVTTSRVVLEITGTGNGGAIRDFTTISDVAFTGTG